MGSEDVGQRSNCSLLCELMGFPDIITNTINCCDGIKLSCEFSLDMWRTYPNHHGLFKENSILELGLVCIVCFGSMDTRHNYPKCCLDANNGYVNLFGLDTLKWGIP